MLTRLIAISALLSVGYAFAGDPLPPDALKEKARLEHLFSLTSKYTCQVKKQVNDMVPRMHAITFAKNVGQVKGTKRIPIPADVIRVWPLFKTLVIRGTGIGGRGSKIVFEGPAGKSEFHYWSGKGFLSGHASRIRLDDTKHVGYSIAYRGSGTIDTVALTSKHGISQKFDASPWSTLGADKPIKPVTIRVDGTCYRAIAGSVELEREKFWRVAGNYRLGPKESVIGIRHCIERGFYPGRMILKLDGLTKWGFNGKKLVEDPNNPGTPDYSIFDDVPYDSTSRKQLDAIFGKDISFASCFDNWPKFMALKNTQTPNTRGTPADYRKAAELSSRVILAQKKNLKKTARWWEVKNESTITTEWVLHAEPGVDSWGKLAEFHNAMADQIHKDSPEIMVGGPTSAWMRLDTRDFELARKQMRFMDETKGRLDFYSHHFYESRTLVMAEGESYSGCYLNGRLEGCIDLLRNHMILTNNVKPMLITETGTLTGMETEVGLWINMKNFSSYLIRYIDHPDKIDLINLWCLPAVFWDKKSVTLYQYKDGKFILTPKADYWMDLWKDFRGKRLPVELQTPDTFIHQHAVVDGSTVHIAVNNLNPYRVAVDLDLKLGDAKIRDIQQTRLYFDKGKICFTTQKRKNLKQLPLAVEETCMVKVTLDRPLMPTTIHNELTFYGDKTLQKTGAPIVITVKCPVKNLYSSRLRICASRDNGFGREMAVSINGTTVTPKPIVLTPKRKKGNFWGYFNINVPTRLLRDTNSIRVTIPEAGGRVTSAALVNVYNK